MEYLTIYKSGKYKRRVGQPYQDGGYIIAELQDGYDGFISCGIDKDISFEMGLMSMYPDLSCLAFDGTIDGLPQKQDNITFIKKNVGKEKSEKTTNLIQYINGDNMFLKMDIEGFEFKVLPELIKNDRLKNIKQMVIEFHTPKDIATHPNYYSSELQDVTNSSMEMVIKDINKTHTLIHLHGNPVPGTHIINDVIIPNVFECTFIRNDFIKDKVKNVKPVPTPLDRPNLPGYKEINLNYWPFVN
jgi:hypothetical protein